MIATLYTSCRIDTITWGILPVGFRPLLQQMNFLLSLLCIRGFHNDVTTCMLEIGESIIHRIFVVWVVFIEAIFPMLQSQTWWWIFALYITCLRFLIYGHSLADIIITWAEFKTSVAPRFFEQNGTYIYRVLKRNWRQHKHLFKIHWGC